MGIGLVLIFWGAVGCFMSILPALVLAVIVAVLGRKLDSGSRWGWTMGAFFLPYAMLVYSGFAFFVHWSWCEAVRGVDPGIGDTWSLRLSNGYDLVMIDNPDEAHIGNAGNGANRLSLDMLGQSEHLIYGRRGESDYVILDTKSDEVKTYPSEAALKEAVAGLGVEWAGLDEPNAFYIARRSLAADITGVLVLHIPALYVVLVLMRRFWRARKAAGVAGTTMLSPP